jgi:hypothetical protein
MGTVGTTAGTNLELKMPATKKISPKAITLSIHGLATRDTASGKHSAYPKRAPSAAPFTLDGAKSEVKRVNGSWKGDRLEFIYWLEEGVARWTDLTADEAKAIDAGAAVTVTNRVTVKVEPTAQPAPTEAPAAEQPAEPTKPKRERKGRRVAEPAPF